MRKIALWLAVPVIAALALAGASAASASPALVHSAGPAVTVATSYQQYLAGYQVYGNGLNPYNEVRGTVHLPASENSSVVPGSVADGMILQQDVDGGWTNGIGFVWDSSLGDCAADQWTLEYGFDDQPAPGPVILASLGLLLDDSASPLGDVCLNGGDSAYLEIHFSTKLHQIAFLEGPSEYGNYSELASVGHVDLPGGFQDPAIGTDVTSGADAQLLTDPSTQSSWTRDGLTQPAGHNTKFGEAGARIPFAFPSDQLIDSTVTGGTPSEANPVTLSASAFGAGASFTTNVP